MTTWGSDGKWRCLSCGAPLEGVVQVPITKILNEPGKATVRVVMLDGDEIHRCEVRAENAP